MNQSLEPQWKKDLRSWKINPPESEAEGKKLLNFIKNGTDPSTLNQRVKKVRADHPVPRATPWPEDDRLVKGGF